MGGLRAPARRQTGPRAVPQGGTPLVRPSLRCRVPGTVAGSPRHRTPAPRAQRSNRSHSGKWSEPSLRVGNLCGCEYLNRTPSCTQTSMEEEDAPCPFDPVAAPVIQEALWQGGVVADCQGIVLEYAQCLPRREVLVKLDDDEAWTPVPCGVVSTCACTPSARGRRYELWRDTRERLGSEHKQSILLATAESDGKTVLEPVALQMGQWSVNLVPVTRKRFSLNIWPEFGGFDLGVEYCRNDSELEVEWFNVTGRLLFLKPIQNMFAQDGISVETTIKPEETSIY